MPNPWSTTNPTPSYGRSALSSGPSCPGVHIHCSTTTTHQWVISTVWAWNQSVERAQCSANSRYGKNFLHFDTSARHSSMNSEKCMFSVLKKELENSSPDWWKNHQLYCIFATQFSVDVNTLPGNIRIEYKGLQWDIQVKKFPHVFLLDFTSPILPENYISHFTITSYSHNFSFFC